MDEIINVIFLTLVREFCLGFLFKSDLNQTRTRLHCMWLVWILAHFFRIAVFLMREINVMISHCSHLSTCVKLEWRIIYLIIKLS